MKNDREKLKAALAKLEASRELREAAKDPANGIIRREVDGRVQFIMTGVPRSSDENEPPVKSEQTVVDFSVNYVIPDDPPPVHPDQPPKRILVSLGEWEALEAEYSVEAGGVILRDTEGAMLASQHLGPDDVAEVVARKLFRKNKGAGFGRRLDYGDFGIV